MEKSPTGQQLPMLWPVVILIILGSTIQTAPYMVWPEELYTTPIHLHIQEKFIWLKLIPKQVRLCRFQQTLLCKDTHWLEVPLTHIKWFIIFLQVHI